MVQQQLSLSYTMFSARRCPQFTDLTWYSSYFSSPVPCQTAKIPPGPRAISYFFSWHMVQAQLSLPCTMFSAPDAAQAPISASAVWRKLPPDMEQRPVRRRFPPYSGLLPGATADKPTQKRWLTPCEPSFSNLSLMSRAYITANSRRPPSSLISTVSPSAISPLIIRAAIWVSTCFCRYLFTGRAPKCGS